MSKTSSNRILKSPNIVFDPVNVVEIRNESFIPITLGQHVEEEILDEEENLTELELAEKILARARNEAEEMIQSAKDDAELILDRMEADAQRALELLEEEATERGYSEGYSKGMAEAEIIKEDARKLYANALREREEIFSTLEGDIVDLISEILSKLLTSTIEIDPQVILCLIRSGFSEAKMSGDVNIRVSDEDYDNVYANKDSLVQYAVANANIEILRDFSLKKSDCIIETPAGVIDCSLDQQYESLRKNLYYIFENR